MPVVLGEVGFVGKIIPGSMGYRAQYARVVRLFVPHRFWRLAEPLTQTYGVPVGVSNNFKAGDDAPQEVEAS